MNDFDVTSPGGRRRKMQRKEKDRQKDKEGHRVIYAR